MHLTTILVLLDLSMAFSSVDRGILLERLEVTFGVDNSARAWFRSNVEESMYAAAANVLNLTDVICGMPQGSVLGPILFILYTADLASIVAEHGLSLHQYADDSQMCGSLMQFCL